MNEIIDDYQIKKKFADLPFSLRHKLEAMPMADGEAPFSGGCVVKSGQGGPLPFARMLWAAVAPDQISHLAYVHYEQGGFTHLYYVACYDCQLADSEALWREVVPEALLTIPALAAVVKKRNVNA